MSALIQGCSVKAFRALSVKIRLLSINLYKGLNFRLYENVLMIQKQ